MRERRRQEREAREKEWEENVERAFQERREQRRRRREAAERDLQAANEGILFVFFFVVSADGKLFASHENCG